MYKNRPSDGELDKKLKAAKAALVAQNGIYANLNKAVGERLGQKMYIKFALKENRYYYLSLHRSRDHL